MVQSRGVGPCGNGADQRQRGRLSAHLGTRPQSLPNQGGSIQQLPNFVGFTFPPRKGYTVGFAFVTTIAWVQETDTQLVSTAAGGPATLRVLGGFGLRAARCGHLRGLQPRPLALWRRLCVLPDGPSSRRELERAPGHQHRSAVARGLRTDRPRSAVQLRLQGGVQYDLDRWRFGLAIRTPGATFYKSGVSRSTALSIGAPRHRALALRRGRERGAPPAVGISGRSWPTWVTALGIEVDLLAYTPISAYSLIASGAADRHLHRQRQWRAADRAASSVYWSDDRIQRRRQRGRWRKLPPDQEPDAPHPRRRGDQSLAGRGRRPGLQQGESDFVVGWRQRFARQVRVRGRRQLQDRQRGRRRRSTTC